jgi:hypothetical protein
MQTITLFNGTSFNLVATPTWPLPSAIELGMNDTVPFFASPFTQVQQVQPFPGGDFWDATITWPPLTRRAAWPWEGCLAELRGRANVIQLGDPRFTSPLGSGNGAPVVNSSVDTYNLPMTTTLVTRGWVASQYRLLMPGDQFQVGYRLYRVCEQVNSDSGGNASITIWPSIRETPPDGTQIVLSNPKGLFRLKDNRRAINWSPSQLTTFSVQVIEAR